MAWLLDPFAYDFFGRALVAGTVVGAMCGALGVFILLRHLAYIGHGLSYGMLAGVAAATFGGANPYLGALAATALGGLLIDRLRRLRGIGGDAAIGIVSTTLFAIGVAIISSDRTRAVDLDSLLFGNVLGVGIGDIVVVFGVAALTAVVLVSIWKALVMATFDHEVAAVMGVRVQVIELLLSLLVGAVVVVALRVIGVLLITAVLVIPAATARLACRSIHQMVPVAAIIGAASSVVGLYVSYYTDMASGPAIVLVAASVFGVVALADQARHRRRMRGARRTARETRASSIEQARPSSDRPVP